MEITLLFKNKRFFFQKPKQGWSVCQCDKVSDKGSLTIWNALQTRGGTFLYKVTLCAAQMGGFLAIFPLEMGLYFEEYSFMFPNFHRSGSQIPHFWSKPKYSELKPTFQNKIWRCDPQILPKNGSKIYHFLVKTKIFGAKPLFKMKFDTVIPKYFLEMGAFSLKWVFLPQISFLEMGPFWMPGRHTPVTL